VLVVGSMAVAAVLVTRYAARWISPETVEVVDDLRAPNGRPGFALVFNSWAWWGVSGQVAAQVATSMQDASTVDALEAVINRALATSSRNCPSRYLLADVHPLPDGGMFVSGWCASQVELENSADWVRAQSP